MAKKRMIHRSLWKSENLAACDMTTRLLFIGIITNADDQGRMLAHPALLRSEIFPFDDIALKTIGHGLRLLADQKSLTCYTAGGKALVQVAHWWEYQQPSWAWPSDLPAPPGWTDRIRYRQGNNVIESNWDGDGASASPPPADDPVGAAPCGCTDPRREATVRSHGAHSEPRPEPTGGPTLNPPVAPAPSGSGSTSGSGSDGGSNSKSSLPRRKSRAAPRPEPAEGPRPRPGEPLPAAAENPEQLEPCSEVPPEPVEGLAEEARSEVPPEPAEGLVEEVCRALLAFGVDGAAEIAAACNPDDILAWLRYAKDKREALANPQGLVVRRLQQGRKPPPTYYQDLADWRRFTNGDYDDYLQDPPTQGDDP